MVMLSEPVRSVRSIVYRRGTLERRRTRQRPVALVHESQTSKTVGADT